MKQSNIAANKETRVFKVGDKVITNRFEDTELCQFVPNMEKFVGKEGEIQVVFPYDRYDVHYWQWPASALTLVTPAETKEETMKENNLIEGKDIQEGDWEDSIGKEKFKGWVKSELAYRKSLQDKETKDTPEWKWYKAQVGMLEIVEKQLPWLDESQPPNTEEQEAGEVLGSDTMDKLKEAKDILLKDEYEQAVKRGGEGYAAAYLEGLTDGLKLASQTPKAGEVKEEKGEGQVIENIFSHGEIPVPDFFNPYFNFPERASAFKHGYQVGYRHAKASVEDKAHFPEHTGRPFQEHP